jgi:DNA-binding PadR family transcriptional regulator
VGQVYTTLARLERDGLVEAAGSADAEGRIAYRLTTQGQTEVTRWWAAAVDRGDTPRDELVIKLALAVTMPGVDVRRLVQTQRTATLHHLQALTRLKGRTPEVAVGRNELSWLLVLDNLVFAAEAEVRWLDHVETRLAREATPAPETGRLAEAGRVPEAGPAAEKGRAAETGPAAEAGSRRTAGSHGELSAYRARR